ncbi:Uridine nucleosidase 1 [Thelohanellus kitauei]|uniref:Uridine nucleosidase 1 n=1 Tax=Thelohanellus kitauei TaxID=669202 RepID=A0A0C2MIZ1_THEKT|nr:Uridine nucleosidase 1 [Thelohanellus kitauei]
MKIIIDTDIGIDDALSIAFLSAHKEAELLAITLVAGNAQMEIISPNVEKIMTFIGEKSIPIYNLIIGKLIETDEYFGPNALGEIELPKQEVSVKKDMSAVQALIHYSKLYPKQLHLVFIGPLTNLALAFLADNEFPSRLASITIMGTDRSEITLKNASEYAEFNAWCDPPAYGIFKECICKIDVPITIVDWGTCFNTRLPFSLEENIIKLNKEKSKKNKYIDFFDIFMDRTNKYIKKNYYENGILTSDLYAVVGLMHRGIFKTIKKVNMKSVVTSGERGGHVEYEEDPKGSIDLVYEIDTELMAEIVVDTLAAVDK